MHLLLFKELTDTSLVHTHVYFPADMKIDKKIAATCQFLETALQLKSITIFCKKSYNVSDCSKLLKAVSGHSNLQQVNITGMFLSMSSLKSLTKTGMFARLTKLVVKIKVDSHQRCLVEILASFKNLYHLELTGLKTCCSKSFSIMALTCSNLNTLITDCHISAAEHISILKYRHNTLRVAKIGLGRKQTRAVLEMIGKCHLLEELDDFEYPVFKGLKEMKSLRRISLRFLQAEDLTLLRKTFSKNFKPQIEHLEVNTADQEDQIYQIIASKCPQLLKLHLKTGNSRIEFRTIKEMVAHCKSLETLSIKMDFPGCDFNFSDLFDGGNKNCHQSLKHVQFNFPIRPLENARSVFEKVPTVYSIRFKNTLMVRKNETLQSIEHFCNVDAVIEEKVIILQVQ